MSCTRKPATEILGEAALSAGGREALGRFAAAVAALPPVAEAERALA